MAHYAFLDENNIVTEVIVGRNEWEIVNDISDWEKYYGDFRGQKCVRTSYNNNIRKQFAGIGFSYNEEADVFVSPQPYPSWKLDENFDWQPPVPFPDDMAFDETSDGTRYVWNEEHLRWDADLFHMSESEFVDEFID